MDLKVIQVLEVVAAVDCGTNSTRLLIGDGEQTLDRRMHITRMGEGWTPPGAWTRGPSSGYWSSFGNTAKYLTITE